MTKKLSVKLKNCYGIKELNYEFDFSKNRVYSIYAPNGMMKTSFAKTFKDIMDGKKSKDVIFPDREPVREILFQGKGISDKQIFVVKPYDSTYDSNDRVSVLLVNDGLRKKHQVAMTQIAELKDNFVNKLAEVSGVKADLISAEISILYKRTENNFFEALLRTESDVNDGAAPQFPDVKYGKIFNADTAALWRDPNVQKNIETYVNRYNELLENSHYFKRGIFNHSNATRIAQQLKTNGFFQAEHSVYLNNKQSQGGGVRITTVQQLEKVIEDEKKSILGDPKLQNAFDGLDKKIKNDKLRDLRDYLAENAQIIAELGKPDLFKDRLWVSYFKTDLQGFQRLLDEYRSAKKLLDEIQEEAKIEQTLWFAAIDLFNSRFSVPFEVGIQNSVDVMLGGDTSPVAAFTFKDAQENKNVLKDDLMAVLSMGERKALYILNIIYEIEARKKEQQETIFIVDDIADSFDYANKYAIVEYLNEISKKDDFYQIILTHNFDFHRTISGRVIANRAHVLNATKIQNGIQLVKELYQKNPFDHWRSQLDKNPTMLIASIPLIRNLADYSGDAETTNKLSSFLHIKEDSAVTVTDLYRIVIDVLSNVHLKFDEDEKESVRDLIFKVAEECIQNTGLSRLEDKIALSIAIRLKAELFVIGKLDDKEFVRNITSNQTRELIEKYKSMFPGDETIRTLDKVNLLTPENIHLNSFMYEPIIDMSDDHLKNLFKELCELG